VLIDEAHRDPLTAPVPTAARHQCVNVRVPIGQVARGLDHGNHPRPYVFVADRRAHQLEDGLPGRPCELAEELPVVQEVRTQHLRDDEDPLRVGHLLEHVLHQQRRRRHRTLGRARRTQLAGLARERQQVLLSAVGAPDAGEAVLEEVAVELAQHLLVDEAAPETVPPLIPLLPLAPDLVELSVEEAVEGSGTGISGPVPGRAGGCHGDASGLPQRGRLLLA